ncbi:nuclear mitotic apparatus protein 1 [Copidosoma floridanum]|uniref:nuclear mitotic apparatus protein 1 n=1 Tax=Copidosoma floridanum TaxID=29053 RepID=UPI000C6F6E3E|nr:nuclear mitotic apparatus protein 1 [Copidosoma floridanum]
MSLRAGDTVTSTKPLPLPTTTKLTTTGEHKDGRAAPRPDTKAATRKRRQPQQPHQETVIPPPPKSRRRGEPATSPEANRSLIGDFFSTLASRIRGTMASTEATLVMNRANSGNRPADDTAMAEMPVKQKQSHELEEEGADRDPSKKRKFEEIEESAGNVTEERDEQVATESKGTIIPQGSPVEEEIIGMCRNIVADMCEKIQSTKKFESRASVATVVLSTGSDHLPEALETWKYATIEADFGNGSRQSIGSKKSASDDDRDSANASSQKGACGRLALMRFSGKAGKSEAERHRRTIQWLEEGARRLREELARARSELHEERKASKLLRREMEMAVKEARCAEALKFTGIVSELKARLSQSPSKSTMDSLQSQSKTDLLKEENHRREIATLKNRLAEAETMVQKLKTDFLGQTRGRKKNKVESKGRHEMRKLEVEIQTLKMVNKKLEERLQIAEECVRARAAEVRQEHEKHEAEMTGLQRALRSDTIKMMDEIQSKAREIEKLEKLVSQRDQVNEKLLRSREDEKMRKLRETDKSHQTRLMTPRLEEKIHRNNDEHECEEDEVTELDRLRELAIEQQEVIEVLRQAVKEKDRKLDCMARKQHKESFYKQYINLEPVAEVDDESEEYHSNCEEADSALSSAPPSLSPQPGSGACRGGCAGPNGVTRDIYEGVLLEIEELQTKLLEEQSELIHARSQVRDLEKALLQETRGSQTSRLALNEKLRLANERESSLVAEISELREQNELLEFRVLELEESPNPRDTPDPADSGIVSPEPIQLYKEHQPNKHRDRAVATVIPYTSATYSHPALPSEAQKSPLSLQESGIFEEEESEYEHQLDGGAGISCSNQSTQTEAPAGELLQEVQRLQELRVRIQERAAKIPIPPLSPIVGDRSAEQPRCECSAEIAPLRQKIGELEGRVSTYETERLVTKQREEELLDENYRLAEKVYCLEEELNKLESKLNQVRLTSDAEVMTDEVPAKRDASQQCEVLDSFKPAEVMVNEVDGGGPADCVIFSPEPVHMYKRDLYKAALVHLEEPKECDETSSTPESSSKSKSCAQCSELWKDCARTEICLRQQIASLEQRESALFKTLRHADENWTKLEADYLAKSRNMSDQLSAQKEINRSLVEQFERLDRSPAGVRLSKISGAGEPMEVDSSVSCTQTEEVQHSAIVKAIEGVTTISLNNVQVLGCADVDDEQTSRPLIVGPPAEVATEAKEEDKSLRASAGASASQQDAGNPSGEKKNYTTIITPRGFKRTNSAGQDARREFLALCLGP